MISPSLVKTARCPDCRCEIAVVEREYRCRGCGRRCGAAEAPFLDLRPAETFAEQTKYLDEALHADARHETVSPPLLSAGVRQDMLRAFLQPGPHDRILDLGCGSGRVLLWNRPSGAWLAGVDVSPFFAREALDSIDLALADLRRLPFADASFNKAYALDVFEHLSREALAGVLGEAARVLAPGGALFVYSHVRRNSRLAIGLRWINRLASRLERAGLLDLSQERLRKSDHLNPLADVPDLARMARDAGFRVARIRFYTPLIGGIVENLLVRMAERLLARRAARRAGAPAPACEGVKAARAEAKAIVTRRGAVYGALRALTAVMKLDVLLFGRITSGPFFALLVRE